MGLCLKPTSTSVVHTLAGLEDLHRSRESREAPPHLKLASKDNTGSENCYCHFVRQVCSSRWFQNLQKDPERRSTHSLLHAQSRPVRKRFEVLTACWSVPTTHLKKATEASRCRMPPTHTWGGVCVTGLRLTQAHVCWSENCPPFQLPQAASTGEQGGMDGPKQPHKPGILSEVKLRVSRIEASTGSPFLLPRTGEQPTPQGLGRCD